jgi:hypothetical protein
MKTSQDDTSLETGLQGSDIVKVPAETTPPTSDPPPNGGFKAWLQVLGAFGLFFSSWWVSFFLYWPSKLTSFSGELRTRSEPTKPTMRQVWAIQIPI